MNNCYSSLSKLADLGFLEECFPPSKSLSQSLSASLSRWSWIITWGLWFIQMIIVQTTHRWHQSQITIPIRIHLTSNNSPWRFLILRTVPRASAISNYIPDISFSRQLRRPIIRGCVLAWAHVKETIWRVHAGAPNRNSRSRKVVRKSSLRDFCSRKSDTDLVWLATSVKLTLINHQACLTI
jgi:hypothetical protein